MSTTVKTSSPSGLIFFLLVFTAFMLYLILESGVFDNIYFAKPPKTRLEDQTEEKADEAPSNYSVKCPICSGTRFLGNYPCRTCGGTGRLTKGNGK